MRMRKNDLDKPYPECKCRIRCETAREHIAKLEYSNQEANKRVIREISERHRTAKASLGSLVPSPRESPNPICVPAQAGKEPQPALVCIYGHDIFYYASTRHNSCEYGHVVVTFRDR